MDYVEGAGHVHYSYDGNIDAEQLYYQIAGQQLLTRRGAQTRLLPRLAITPAYRCQRSILVGKCHH
jgi:hypothetical protein